MSLITILGSCRQESLYKNYNITSIQKNISYPHYTKEILEVIKFCKYGHILPEDTLTTFRTSILHNKKLYFNNILENNFKNTKLCIIEIASKISYKYNNRYVHHILYDNETYKNDIIVSQQTDEEIEEDIINIIKELNNIKIIIVGHIVTYNKGKRYELINLLEQICNKYNILFINPITEITKLGYNIKDLVIDEPIISHYNELGHSVIEKIYNHYICQN